MVDTVLWLPWGRSRRFAFGVDCATIGDGKSAAWVAIFVLQPSLFLVVLGGWCLMQSSISGSVAGIAVVNVCIGMVPRAMRNLSSGLLTALGLCERTFLLLSRSTYLCYVFIVLFNKL